jgi:hypothetical protein
LASCSNTVLQPFIPHGKRLACAATVGQDMTRRYCPDSRFDRELIVYISGTRLAISLSRDDCVDDGHALPETPSHLHPVGGLLLKGAANTLSPRFSENLTCV